MDTGRANAFMWSLPGNLSKAISLEPVNKHRVQTEARLGAGLLQVHHSETETVSVQTQRPTCTFVRVHVHVAHMQIHVHIAMELHVYT